MQFHIENMSCGGCARGVTKAVQALDAGAQVTVDLVSRMVQVQTSAAQPAVEAALAEAGYPGKAQ